MKYWFLFDSTGKIVQKEHLYLLEWTNVPNGLNVMSVDDTDTIGQVVFNHPEHYLIQNDQFVSQPYLTLTFASGTITAILNNPPGTPPTQVTFSVLGQTYTETLTNNQATLSLTIHPAVAGQQINVTASATGCVDGSLNIGGSGTSISMKVVTTTTPNTISPVYRKDGEAYYACLISTESLLADIGTAISHLTHTIYEIVLPAIQASTYTPVALTSDQENAVNDIKSNVLPNLYTTLSNAYPSAAGSTKQLQYARYVADTQSSYKSFGDYVNDIQTLGWI